MDLINLLPQKRNSVVTVNGTEYRIDQDGVCRGVKGPDAGKMLQNVEAWREWDGKSPAAKKSGAPAIGLIASNGAVVHKDTTKPDMGQSEVLAKVDHHEATARGEANPAPSAAAEETEEWPDPKESMEPAFLRKMADAYEVKYTKKTTAKELCKKIMAEMYPKD